MTKTWIVCALILSAGLCRGQSDTVRVDFSTRISEPLIEVLNDLTREHNIVFSYNPATLKGLEIPVLPARPLSLDAFLDRVLEGTGIGFERVSGTYILFVLGRAEPIRTSFSLTGVVRDTTGGESLPYASVSILGTDIATTANAEGRFSLLAVPSDTSLIEVRYLGYAPLVVVAGSVRTNGSPAVFGMVPRSRVLPSVEVRSQVDDVVEINRRAGKLTFNATDLVSQPGTGEKDLFEGLQRLPGIASTPPAHSGLRIRGSGSGENLVMFDGIPVYHLDHMYGFFSAFNTRTIKNVQVYKGGFGARFGGRTSGVINISGIDGNKLHPEFELTANALSLNGVVQLPLVKNRASLVVAHRRSFTHLWPTTTFKRMFNHLYNANIPTSGGGSVDLFDGTDFPDYHYGDFNAKISFKPGAKDAVAMSFYSSTDRLAIDFDAEDRGVRRTSKDDTEWGNTGGSFKWARMWNKHFSSSVIVGLSRYESGLEAEEMFYENGKLFSTNVFEHRVEVEDLTVRLDQTVEVSNRSKLDFGWWYTDNRVSSRAQNAQTILRDSTLGGQVHAGYVSYGFRLGAFQMEIGLRGNGYDRTGKIYYAPRWSASYRIGDKLEIKSAVGIHYQMIRRLNERSLYLSIPETWTLADATTIPVARSDQYQLELHGNLDGWNWVIGGFYKNEKGVVEMIYPEIGPPTGETAALATGGNRRIRGVDAMVEKTMRNHNFLMSYSFADVHSSYESIADGGRFPSPGHARHEASLLYGVDVSRWEFSAAFTWTSGRSYTPIQAAVADTTFGEGIRVEFGPPGSETLDDSHHLDLSVTYTFPLNKGILQAGVSIYNVYDHRSTVMMDYYAIPDGESGASRIGVRPVEGPGIIPSAFVKIRF